jgi:peptidyl-prolyl cis-trans isomerase A (cyclophilin A)
MLGNHHNTTQQHNIMTTQQQHNKISHIPALVEGRSTGPVTTNSTVGHKKNPWYRSPKVKTLLCVILSYGCIFALLVIFMTTSRQEMKNKKPEENNDRKHNSANEEVEKKVVSNDSMEKKKNNVSILCPYETIGDLTPEEYKPKKGSRHIVNPPPDTNVSLVCCTTTAGPLSILVHHAWAPNGAKRFLEMVESHYYESKIPLMRCIKNFLCQFGLGGPTKLQHAFSSTIQDDPNWLPEGPQHRMNEEHVMRYAKGYMAYAGAGPHSRNIQLIVALKANGPLGGGSPWEVPFAELVGSHSFDTLDSIYTGYGEDGPSQGSLWKENALEKVTVEFPEIDYITNCWISDRS